MSKAANNIGLLFRVSSPGSRSKISDIVISRHADEDYSYTGYIMNDDDIANNYGPSRAGAIKGLHLDMINVLQSCN